MCPLGEMIDHMSLSREFYAPFANLSPGMIGLGGSDGLFTHVRRKKTISEKFLVVQRTLDFDESDNVY